MAWPEVQVGHYRAGLYFPRARGEMCRLPIFPDPWPQLPGKVPKQRHSRSFSIDDVNLRPSAPPTSSLDRNARSGHSFVKETAFCSSRNSYTVPSHGRQSDMNNCYTLGLPRRETEWFQTKYFFTSELFRQLQRRQQDICSSPQRGSCGSNY